MVRAEANLYLMNRNLVGLKPYMYVYLFCLLARYPSLFY